MRPPQRLKTEFEKVVIGDFIKGKIVDINYDNKHSFKYLGQEKIAPGVRFVFELEGYQYKHYSRWMNFNTGAKANLYTKYISKLVEGAKPDMDFDLDILKGLKVKTLWSEEGDYQRIENIFPLTAKIKIPEYQAETPPEEEPPVDEGSFDGEATE